MKSFTIKWHIGVNSISRKILVAIALIELGMKYEDAVDLIRKKRRGAINSRQLEFLAKYKRRKYFLKGKNKCQIQ